MKLAACILTLLSFAAAGAAAPLDLVVRASMDGTDLLVERRLDWRALGLDPARVRVEENGRPLPAQVEPDRVIFRLPGPTRAGQTRRVTLCAGEPAPAPDEGVRVEAEGGAIHVDNGVTVVEHTPAKNGGLPAKILFKHTGRSEDSFAWNDRVYDKGAQRGYSLNLDKAPALRVVSRGPLVAVVETSARYVDATGRAPESAPRATYRFRYAAGSPLVRVEAHIQQETAFGWSELHFVELNTKALNFPRWMLAQPDASGTFTNSEKGATGRWGAMLNDREAIGLRAGKAMIYDGHKGYGNYLHGDWLGWYTTRWQFAGWLYLGPADDGLSSLRKALGEAEGGITTALSAPAIEARMEALGKRTDGIRGAGAALARWHLGQARASMATATSLQPAGEELDRVERSLKTKPAGKAGAVVEDDSILLCAANAEVALAFARNGNAVAVKSLFDAAGGREFAREVDANDGLWQLTFRPADFSAAKAVVVSPGETPCAWSTSRSSSGVEIHLTWKGIPVGEEAGAADVTVKVRVPDRGGLTEWRIRVANRSRQLGLWQVDFPRIANLTVSREGALAVPMGWGQLYKDATRAGHYDGSYPNGWATMQFASLFDGGRAVYLAAHDGQAHHKRLVTRPRPDSDALSFAVAQYPDSMAAPGTAYESPYPVVVGTHAGDWFDAAKIYRAWAMKESAWFPKLPLAGNPAVPEWLKQNPLWCCSGGDPKNVVKNVTAFREFFGMPIGFHWYSWHQIPFDDHYPEYFPPKEGFADAVAQLKAKGVHVMPYINGRLFDSRTDSWKNENAQDYCALSDKGEKYVEVYGSKVPLSPMCPATPYWQEKVAGIVERLVGECGVSGVYIDQIGAAGTAPCFNPKHAHGAGGSASWVPGYREMLTLTRRKMRAKDPQSFLTTEDAAEPYQGGIDAFLMCNQTRGGLVPMYPAVYGGRALTFGRYLFDSDAKASAPMITKLGEMFTFGAQLGWIDAFILRYPKEAGYLKRLAETRLAAAKYLALGEMLRPPVIETAAPPVKTTWNLWKSEFPIEFPAVIGSAWRADDGSVALVLTNLTEQKVRFRWQHEGKRAEGEIEGLSAAVVKREK